MARKPDVPCAGCGKLLWSGKGTLPPGQARCQACRRAAHIRACARCAREFDATSHGESDHAYCSITCANHARRQTPSSRLCKQCGTEFALDPKNNGQAYCSTACVGQASRKPKAKASRIYYVECGECTKLFVSRRKGKELCSTECRDRRQARRYYDNPKYRDGVIASTHARRAHKLGLGNHRITITYLIERDSGRCRATVCHFRSRKVAILGSRGPRRPSMDHIVPLSRGGAHTLDNVHLTHYRCNLSKGNRGGGEQLRLIG